MEKTYPKGSSEKTNTEILAEIIKPLEQKCCEVWESNITRKKKKLRQSACEIYDFMLHKYKTISKIGIVNLFFQLSEVIVATVATLSVIGAAVNNLAVYPMSGIFYVLTLATIVVMNLAILVFTSAKAFGTTKMKDKNAIDYQKMRLIEIKLFRSPYMPDLKKEKQNIRSSSLYMSYYTLEKQIGKQIRYACSNPSRVDRQVILSEFMPEELRAQALFVMTDDPASDEDAVSGAISRRAVLHNAYCSLYNIIVHEKGFVEDLYKVAHTSAINEFLEVIKKKLEIEKYDRVKHCAHYIVAACMFSFACVAKDYVTQLDVKAKNESGQLGWYKITKKLSITRLLWQYASQSIRRIDSTLEKWTGLEAKKRDDLKIKGFQWALQQHIKRQCKKLSNTYHIGFFRKIFIEVFCLLEAILPRGLSMLATSPVMHVSAMIGQRWKGNVGSLFWACAGVNHVLHAREDMHKLWQKLCEFAAKTWGRGQEVSRQIEHDTWAVRWDHIWRGVMAMMMALAQMIFTHATVSSFMRSPALAGAESLHYSLFTMAPWLVPFFTPLCCVLTFVGTCLCYAHATKYLSIAHSPEAKKEPIGRSLWHYFLVHNFDLTKKPAYKLAKLFVTLAAVAQTMVIYVSNEKMLGAVPAFLLMPAVFLTYATTFRKFVDQGFDLRYQIRREGEGSQLTLKNFYFINVKRKMGNAKLLGQARAQKSRQREVLVEQDPRQEELQSIVRGKPKEQKKKRVGKSKKASSRKASRHESILPGNREASSSDSMGTDASRSRLDSPDKDSLLKSAQPQPGQHTGNNTGVNFFDNANGRDGHQDTEQQAVGIRAGAFSLNVAEDRDNDMPSNDISNVFTVPRSIKSQ